MWTNDDDDYDELHGYVCGSDQTECGIASPTCAAAVNSGSFCRSCNEFNEYAPPDDVVSDGKHTCYMCITSSERWKHNVPADKEKALEKYYGKVLRNYFR